MSCDFLTTKGILRKLGGDKVSGKVYTFNGDTSGKFAANNIVNISEDVPDLKNLTKIVLTNSDGETGEYPLSDLTYMEHEDMEGFVYPNDMNRMYVVSLYSGVGGGPAGLYVRCADSDYVSRIEFADTIVPIEPKYLPGVCLPVVELETVIENNAVLTAEESAMMAAAKAAGMPIVVSYHDANGMRQAVFNRFINSDMFMFSTTVDGAIVGLIDTGKVWAIEIA